MNMIKKVMLLAIFIVVSSPWVSQAKNGDDQNQIILLNDSAAALEDSNPQLSKSLAKFADEKEKEWEDKNANKNAPSAILNNNAQLQERIKLLTTAALAIQPAYPLIAKSLNKMAQDMDGIMKNEK